MRFLTLISLGLSAIISFGAVANELTSLAPQHQTGASQHAPTVPKNMVIMIGDGMGPAYTTAYRYFKDNPNTQEIEQTVFDRLLVGMSSTYPARSSGYVTDSAASATALATGYKTYNGAISVDEQKQPIPTLFELARARGMATGLAVTSQVNHATPAAFMVHNEHRKNYVEIAEAYLDTGAEVILGGGQKYFSEELLEKFKAKGYQHITEFSQLDGIDKPKVLGLLAEVQLPWVIEDKQGHKLRTLTQKALDLLSQHEQGFVLLIEGSLIDWAGHSNDIASAMHEVDEFAAAMEVVEQYVREHQDTLLVATADHNTGGLSIAAGKDYAWHPEFLHHVTMPPYILAEKLVEQDEWQSSLTAAIPLEFTSEQMELIADARAQGAEPLTYALQTVIDQHSNTGWTTVGHTGLDVQVFATGPGASLFNGSQDNTDIAKKMISLLPQLPAKQQ
ncbi:alkaline phosphatase [Shewanella sp. WXL01]|uniref:alkaline phosphatase n=1 Tax=Shewanella sp. WXL01 TaxID=2709721 RepID=UPI001438417B|nr:alkaline phosphatase [Shewanella sp. WXL01]NKF49279.1 alkaline phosphatase [Shewanella sp. WXL01]